MSSTPQSDSDLRFEWQCRVMEIRKDPKSATPEEIVKLTDDFFMRLYFGDPVRCSADLSRTLSGSVKNVTQK